MIIYFECRDCGSLQDDNNDSCERCRTYKRYSNPTRFIEYDEYEKLRKGIEDWLNRMEYYSDNQYGKREMKELLK